jgi:sporulation protein YlmC with PRC-barrel domain
MKTNSIQIILASLAGVITMPALGQDYGNTNHMGDYDQRSHLHQPGYQLRDTIRANDLMGMAVENSQKEKLGEVKDVAVDVTSGRVLEVILSTGGFMGMGSKLTAVPVSAFQYNSADKLLRLDASMQKIKAAPDFDSTEWNDAASSNQMVKTYEYYGQQPYFVTSTEGWRTNANGSPTQTLPRNMDGTVNTLGARTMDTAHNVASLTNEMGGASWEDSHYQAGYIQKGSSLIGSEVKNAQDEKIGSVDNFIVSLPTGRMVAIILSTGA